MKNNIIIGLLLLLTATCSAQYFEAGIFLGASNYSGDLDPDARARLFRETHFAGGILARYPIGEQQYTRNIQRRHVVWHRCQQQ